jgi:hypothetical protein
MASAGPTLVVPEVPARIETRSCTVCIDSQGAAVAFEMSSSRPAQVNSQWTEGRNVGIAPPAVAHTCSNDANADFFYLHDVFP